MTDETPGAERPPEARGDVGGPAPETPRSAEPAIPDRSADDRDIGWGRGAGDEDDGNDERLERERPPHW